MRSNWIKAPFFTIALVGLFIWAGEIVTRASGGGASVPLGEGVSVENGEQIFWDVGKCHTCHSVGTRGSTVRCPNLGQAPLGPPIGVRAGTRAAERSAQVDHTMSATEYLVESIADPSAYVVEGYKDEMPKVFEPPISLNPDQITSVVLYLQSIGGAPDPGAIVLPANIRQASTGGGGADLWQPYLEGDSTRGEQLFFDVDGPAPCAKCHRVGERGANVGPELTSVAGTRTAQFIIESIVSPSAEIASGYEASLIQLTNGRIVDGIVSRETSDSLWIRTGDGQELGFGVAQVARRRVQEISLMPDNFADVLTVLQLHDLLAYLSTLR